MEKDEHLSPQAAVDYAVDRMLAGEHTTVTLKNHKTAVINFVPRKTKPRMQKETVAVQQRIGDSLRQERLDLLGRAFVQGFITQQEWDQRAAAALSAATRADLAHLTLDLTEVEQEKPVSHRHKTRVGLPAVITLMALAMFVGVMIGVILA